MKGMVLEILNCSLNDGPGVRTAVFLKGCPLKCIWCHNPESQDINRELRFKKDKCIVCGLCEKTCENGVHDFTKQIHTLNRQNCIKCGDCIEICPVSAVSFFGYEMEAEDVLKQVLKEKEYFAHSGGGITITGGEPLYQPEYTLELLKITKANNIHTAVETSGLAKKEDLLKILEYTDLFLFDYKHTNPELHLNHTGVSNKAILENLDLLYRCGKDIILRCPLIANVNDSDEHLKAIGHMRSVYPNIKSIEIMPYHNMGTKKNDEIGKLTDYYAENTIDEKKRKWLEVLMSYGDCDIIMN